MNGKVMNAIQEKSGILPCLDVPTDTGIYFFNEGGYVGIGKLSRDYTIWSYVLSVCIYKGFFNLLFTLVSNYLLL